MTETLPARGHAETLPATHVLPAARPGTSIVPDVTRTPTPHRLGQALVRSIGSASNAVYHLNSRADPDITVGALATAACMAATPQGVLRAAAAFLRGAPAGLQLHGALWAQVPDVEDSSEYWLTLLLSDIDPETGEADGATHHGDTRTAGVTVYIDAATARTGPALPRIIGLDHTADSPAEAFETAADLLDDGPDLRLDGVLWAQVPAARPGTYRHRLTLLTASRSL